MIRILQKPMTQILLAMVGILVFVLVLLTVRGEYLPLGVTAPHRFCLNSRTLLMIFFTTDIIIGISYMIISSALAYVGFRYKDVGLDISWHTIPRWIYASFALFIVTCGFTHFTDVINLWIAVYWVAAVVRITCALSSVTTAAAMPELMRSFSQKRT